MKVAQSWPQGKPNNTGVGSLSLLQGIFPTQESNWGLLHCRWIPYQLSYRFISINSPDAQRCWENGGRQRRLFCRQTQCGQHVGSPAELRTEDPAEASQASWKHITKGTTRSKNQTAWTQVPPLPLSVTLTKLNFIFLYKMMTSSTSDVVMNRKRDNEWKTLSTAPGTQKCSTATTGMMTTITATPPL